MYNNNNQSVIKKITRRSLKTNHTRNLLVILAIILTTFMITSIFSLGFSLAKNYQIMMLREAGSTASISISKPTAKQLTTMKQLANQQSVGLQINLGSVINQNPNSKMQLNLEYHDKTRFEKQITPAISDTKGQYPKKENEIMTSRWVLKQMGIKNPKVGMSIPLTMDLHGKIITQDFILSGFYQDYGFQSNTGSILLSKELVDHYQINPEQYGVALIESKVGKRDQLTKEVQSIKRTDNQDIEYNYDPKEEVISTGIVASSIVLIISLFIVLSGYLLIYNVLYISVVKDIHFYGLLKTIGTSPKQIKHIVKRQALCLCLIGIPFGILLSVLVSFAIIPTAMAGLGMGGYNSPMPTDISFSPIIFIGGIVFAFFTTLISCKKPAKIASSISPVEATRYTGTSEKIKTKKKKSTHKNKEYKMAFHNIFRNKKRAVIVFLSLFMGIITFLSIHTFLSSISVENYIDTYVPHDFNIHNLPPVSQKITNKDIATLKQTDGVKQLLLTQSTTAILDNTNNQFLPFIKNDIDRYNEEINEQELIKSYQENPDTYNNWTLSIEKEVVKLAINQKNEINLDEFENGKLALINTKYIDDPYLSEIKKLDGKPITLTDTKTKKKVTLNIKLVNTDQFPYDLGSTVGCPTVYISQKSMEQLNTDALNYIIDIDVVKSKEPHVHQVIKKLIGGNRSINLTSKTETTKDFTASLSAMNIIGTSLSIILILIGILNFINIMVTGINARRKELAVLESIGMTKKQITKMVTFEGLYYAIITSFLVLILGTPIIYLIVKLTKQIVEYAVFQFPLLPILFLFFLLFLVCLSVPSLVFRNTSKQSITERLRENED